MQCISFAVCPWSLVNITSCFPRGIFRVIRMRSLILYLVFSSRFSITSIRVPMSVPHQSWQPSWIACSSGFRNPLSNFFNPWFGGEFSTHVFCRPTQVFTFRAVVPLALPFAESFPGIRIPAHDVCVVACQLFNLRHRSSIHCGSALSSYRSRFSRFYSERSPFASGNERNSKNWLSVMKTMKSFSSFF